MGPDSAPWASRSERRTLPLSVRLLQPQPRAVVELQSPPDGRRSASPRTPALTLTGQRGVTSATVRGRVLFPWEVRQLEAI